MNQSASTTSTLAPPRVTVATVVERLIDNQRRFLMVEERDKTTGLMVFNQPAGHVEGGESLQQAAKRETLEETGWQVELTGVIGVSMYTSPSNNKTYQRVAFAAKAQQRIPEQSIDPDIHQVHWLTYDEIVAFSARMRSPLVIATLDRYLKGQIYPLELLYTAQ